MLNIRLLGHFEIDQDGQALAGFGSPRLQMLLAALLLARGAPLPRRQLAFLFWPDSSEAQAQTNLRNLLHLLRRTLPEAAHFIEMTPTAVRWQPEAPFTLDVIDFERIAADIDADRAPEQVERTITRAETLYRGDLLEGLDAERIEAERAALRRRFQAMLDRAVDALEARGECALAIRYAERRLESDPLREESYRHLIRLHTANEDRGSALSVYRACLETLSRELDVAPSPATQRPGRRQIVAHRDREIVIVTQDAPVGIEISPGRSF